MASTAKTTALSKERIIKAAYQLAKKDPINALSMRKIATKLKVTPMAIYKYFDDKNELTAAVIDTHLKKSNLIPTGIDADENWREWVKASFLRMWDAYDSAPGMIQYMSNATSFGPAVLDWQNEVLKVLITTGLTPKQALTAHAAMSELATGSTILVPIRKQGVQKVFPTIWKDLSEGRTPNLEDLGDNIPMVEYPWLLMCGQAMMEDMNDSRAAFSSELDLVLDSLDAQITAKKQTS
ncbi:hypothetical protein A9Q81_14305 [Gammaproteobacteria bacterium 42_54_T18]|nr:hypothetical protein A9Q81_14305 [Gammaproteobacteria bacterium 42_54_T18]